MKIYAESYGKNVILNKNLNGGYDYLFDEKTGRYILYKDNTVCEYIFIKSWNFEIEIEKSNQVQLINFIFKNHSYLKIEENENERKELSF